MKIFRLLLLALILMVSACTTTPPKNAWYDQPSRTVDAGYIVYIGKGEDSTLEKATFKAESAAIADLANECSFLPKGARFEDHYDEEVLGRRRAYAKIGITFEECEAAKRTLDPEEIRKLANVKMAEQLKQYEAVYNAPAEGKPVQVATATETYRPIHEDTDLFFARQRVFYYKQSVILAEPMETAHIDRTAATLQAQEVARYESAHPQIRYTPQTWSATRPAPPQGSFTPVKRRRGRRHTRF